MVTSDVQLILLSSGSLTEALAFLDAAEHVAQGPLVDEWERHRLEQAVAGDPLPGWRAVAARRAGQIVGYGGVATPPTGPPSGDAAPGRQDPDHVAVLLRLLHELAALAGGDGALLWCRQATEPEVSAATRDGFRVARRLGIFGRTLPVDGDSPPPAAGYAIRPYRPDEDDPAVVEVLAQAYAGTPDGIWDLAEFARHRTLPWFRADDLLVAVDPQGWVGGLHWLKRRNHQLGEVHNLAVHPEAQGHGLGPWLLRAGLDHLAARGHAEVVLWTDRENPKGLELYRRAGFEPRWDDVAFTPV
jgi:mycothiol synthase